MRLFLLMAVVTAIEVILIAKVGTAIGFWATLLIIIGTAFVGSWLLKKQWRFVMGKMQSLQSQPSTAIIEALILLICGVLLVTPGFLTDIVGFCGLLPPVRERLVDVIKRNSGKFVQSGFRVYGSNSTFSGFSSSGSQQQSSQNGEAGNTIEGEFERRD